MNDESTSGDIRMITLAGELNISCAAEMILRFKESLSAGKIIRIAVQEVTSVDLACLQVFCSAHRTAGAMGKSLAFTVPIPAAMQAAITRSGFKRHSGCSFSPDTTCLCCGAEE